MEDLFIELEPDGLKSISYSQHMTSFSFFLQDKSSSIAPHSVKYLVGEDADIIHVNVGSGMTTAHIASLLEADSRSHIWAFGARNQAEVRENMEKLGVKGIVL